MWQRRLAPRLDYIAQRLPTHPQIHQLLLEHFAAHGISQATTQVCLWPASFGNSMKNRPLNPAYAFALCYAAMVCLAIAVNLMPIFLTTLRVNLGGRAGLTGEQLGRISAITFAGLVGGILFTGPWPIDGEASCSVSLELC
jgi:hypothetical protein